MGITNTKEKTRDNTITYSLAKNVFASNINIVSQNGVILKVMLQTVGDVCQEIETNNGNNVTFKILDLDDFPLFAFKYTDIHLQITMSHGATCSITMDSREPTETEMKQYYQERTCAYVICYKYNDTVEYISLHDGIASRSMANFKGIHFDCPSITYLKDII